MPPVGSQCSYVVVRLSVLKTPSVFQLLNLPLFGVVASSEDGRP